MTSTPALRRWLAVAGTGAVFAVVLGVLACQKKSPDVLPSADAAEEAKKKEARSWPLFGGTVQRNLVNLTEKGLALDFSVAKGKEKNIKWWASLGSKAYGGPTFSGGTVFGGTHNNRPRNPAVKGDQGIVMCFRESDGQFLWQAVHDKLEAGRVNDWPYEGICSAPVIEGDRIWYVSNRCEVICASTDGLAAGNRGVKDEKYKSKLDADVIWRLDMMKQEGVFPHNLATCSPLIVGKTLFVITSNGVDEGHIRIPKP